MLAETLGLKANWSVTGSDVLTVAKRGLYWLDCTRSLPKMHQAGARTVAEDESTGVVFGMPKQAIKLGGIDKIVPLARPDR